MLIIFVDNAVTYLAFAAALLNYILFYMKDGHSFYGFHVPDDLRLNLFIQGTSTILNLSSFLFYAFAVPKPPVATASLALAIFTGLFAWSIWKKYQGEDNKNE